ncbi:diguanylate cyclase domain-containing protein, partial [Clostridioides difficile]
TQHEIESNKYYCTVTAGVAMYPEDGDNYLDLFKHADIALDIAENVFCTKEFFSVFTTEIKFEEYGYMEKNKFLKKLRGLDKYL